MGEFAVTGGIDEFGARHARHIGRPTPRSNRKRSGGPPHHAAYDALKMDGARSRRHLLWRANEGRAYWGKKWATQPHILAERPGDGIVSAGLLGDTTYGLRRGKHRIVANGDPRSRLDDAGFGIARETLEGRHQAAACAEQETTECGCDRSQ